MTASLGFDLQTIVELTCGCTLTSKPGKDKNSIDVILGGQCDLHEREESEVSGPLVDSQEHAKLAKHIVDMQGAYWK